jgi:hypothetical protein
MFVSGVANKLFEISRGFWFLLMASLDIYGCSLRRNCPKRLALLVTRLTVTVNNWMSESLLAYIQFLEARVDPGFNKGLENLMLV